MLKLRQFGDIGDAEGRLGEDGGDFFTPNAGLNISEMENLDLDGSGMVGGRLDTWFCGRNEGESGDSSRGGLVSAAWECSELAGDTLDVLDAGDVT